MIYINHNNATEQLTELVEARLHNPLKYMSDDFNQQQNQALELLKQRVFLEEIIEETITFNKKINWDHTNKNLSLAYSAEDLVEIFQLRSEIYETIGFKQECKDIIEGLNFDLFDKNSAILLYRTNRTITGTTRLIFDSKNKLPTDSKFSFDLMRKKYHSLTELSRLVVKHKTNGLNVEFKNLTSGIYNVYKNNDVDLIVSGMKQEHYKLYSKFGGFKLDQELGDYGKIEGQFFIAFWDPSQISPFFKKMFL